MVPTSLAPKPEPLGSPSVRGRFMTSCFLSVSFIMADFSQRGIDVSAVVWQVKGQTPCACCVVCPSTGSRTVVLSDT